MLLRSQILIGMSSPWSSAWVCFMDAHPVFTVWCHCHLHAVLNPKLLKGSVETPALESLGCVPVMDMTSPHRGWGVEALLRKSCGRRTFCGWPGQHKGASSRHPPSSQPQQSWGPDPAPACLQALLRPQTLLASLRFS